MNRSLRWLKSAVSMMAWFRSPSVEIFVIMLSFVPVQISEILGGEACNRELIFLIHFAIFFLSYFGLQITFVV